MVRLTGNRIGSVAILVEPRQNVTCGLQCQAYLEASSAARRCASSCFLSMPSTDFACSSACRSRCRSSRGFSGLHALKDSTAKAQSDPENSLASTLLCANCRFFTVCMHALFENNFGDQPHLQCCLPRLETRLLDRILHVLGAHVCRTQHCR